MRNHHGDTDLRSVGIPPAVIDGGMAAVGLPTWLMIGKFLDHLPLYRLEQIAARDGVILSSSTPSEYKRAEGRDMRSEERRRLQAEKSLPALTELKGWIALMRCAETGDLPIDNNPVGNSIRPIAWEKELVVCDTKEDS